jgi:hypothetical protein
MSRDPLFVPIINNDNSTEVIDLNSNPFSILEDPFADLQEEILRRPRSKSIQPTSQSTIQPRKRVRRRDDQFIYPDYNDYNDLSTIIQDQDEYIISENPD